MYTGVNNLSVSTQTVGGAKAYLAMAIMKESNDHFEKLAS